MYHQISLHHLNDEKFDILQNGKTIRIDGADENNSTGVRPKALILSALAGCTAIDVVDMLKKMRVHFSDFAIDVKADLTDEHPKVYSEVQMMYRIKMAEEDKDKMERVVNLSMQKYCGVSAMIKTFAPLHISIVYL